MKDALKKLLYADDLALVANGKQELQETLEEWNGLFTRHGLKINVEKTEVLALTELQQQRLQVCENNWVRQIARVTRADRRRMVELREETGVQRSLTERLVRSRLQWAGHVERMADDRLPKRAAELREQGRRRRGRPRLRWEDCDKRDVRKAGEEEDWKKKTRDRGGWKILSDEAVKKLRAAPHP